MTDWFDLPFTHPITLSDGAQIAEIEVTCRVVYEADDDWRISGVYRTEPRRDGTGRSFDVECPPADPLVMAILQAAEHSDHFSEAVVEAAENNDCRRRAA